jgi:tetratricopeptide (TPR) repeat protein
VLRLTGVICYPRLLFFFRVCNWCNVRRSFHWKRSLIVLGVLLLLGTGFFFLNNAQARRQSSIIKDVAEKAEASIAGDSERRAEAIEHYAKYLKYQPNDEKSNLKYAQLLIDQHKAEPSLKNAIVASSRLETFLRRFPDHPIERRQLADTYIKLGKIQNAREHIDVLFKSPKGDFQHDIELLEMASLCEQVNGEMTAAIKYLEDAIETQKAPVRVYQQVLQLLNANKSDNLRESKIANHIHTLQVKEPYCNSIEARIAVARFELFRHEFENAHKDIEFARVKLPGGQDNPDVLFVAAEWEIAGIHKNSELKPRLAAARALLEKAFAIDPKNVQVGLYLADILDKQGERPHAINILRETAKAYGPINDQYWTLIDYLIDLKNQDLSTTLIDRAAINRKDDPRLMYFRGRLALLNNNWMQAKNLLEESSRSLVRLTAHHKRAMVGLGIIYGVLQNPDLQLSSYRSALRDDPDYAFALIGEAEALAKLGRLDEAINRYQVLVTAKQISDLRPTLARLRLLELIRKLPENRNWTTFDSDDTLGAAAERSCELQILYAQGLAIRGEKGKAIEVLNEVLKNEKNSSATSTAWVALARIREAGKPEAALLVLDEAQKQVGDTVDLRLARADVLIFRAKPPEPSEFEALGNNADKFLISDQYRLWFGLGQAALNSMARVPEGNARNSLRDAAMHFLRLAATADPHDLYCRAVLVDLALPTAQKDQIESTINELATLEGPNGPISTLAKVCLRIDEVKAIQNSEARKTASRELRELINKVQVQRPGWGRVYVALASLDELEGLTDQALEHYRTAVKEGDRDEKVIRKTVALYRERKLDAQAAGMLDELSTKMILPDDLERFRTIYEMINRTIPRSERPTIDRIAPSNSLDARILLLRGSLLATIREDAEALRAFRRAIELAEDNPDNWEHLVRQLVRTGDLAAAKQAVAEAERKLIPLPQKSETARAELFIVLGECHELCSDLKTAGLRYQEALKIAPKELSTNRRMVEFLRRIAQREEADKLLYKLSEDPAQDLARWSRRYLAAVSLMDRPDAYQQRNAALALIARNLAVAPNDPEDIKARAIIQTIDPETREEGVQVLKDYWAKGDLTPDESVHLGMLIYSLGPTKIPESVKYFESAAKPRPGGLTKAEHIARLIQVYSSLDKIDIAEATLERLKAAAPNVWETTREEARLLMKKSLQATIKGDRDEANKLSDQARSLILKFPGYDSAEMIPTKSGALLSELGFNVEAETLYRKLIDLSNSPTAHAPLAILYLQTKKSAEAVKLAREFESKAPALLTAQILSIAVRENRPAIADKEKEISAWLDEKISNAGSKPELAGLLCARAELLDAQGKYAESIVEYRRSLEAAPSDKALNNLSMLLALYEPKKADEAIRLMTGLIDLRGPAPMLLDTRAVAYIVKGGEQDSEKAVQDLKMARLQHARSVYAYHLAWAYDLQLKRGERDKLLEEAAKIGINIVDVHPLEHEKYRKLFGPDAK